VYYQNYGRFQLLYTGKEMRSEYLRTNAGLLQSLPKATSLPEQRSRNLRKEWAEELRRGSPRGEQIQRLTGQASPL